MSLQEVTFQTYRANFPTTFLKICGRGENPWSTTCRKTVVVGGKQASFYVSLISWRSQDCHKVEVYLATLCFGDITGFTTVVSE